MGLEGQVAAVQDYARRNGAEIVRAYQEVESGKRADRPELAKALAHAKRAGARLCIAKLDRLSRNVAFLSALMESGVDFVACDNPHLNRLTTHILAAVAEDEARRISDRTKAALAAYKARGGLLGGARPECRNLTDGARAKGAVRGGRAVAELARAAVADLAPMMVKMRKAHRTYRQIADALNAEGHTTRRGKSWAPVQVKRALDRLAG